MGGIIVLLLFYAITLWASLMLAECQETDGVKHPTYRAAVKHILGGQRSADVLPMCIDCAATFSSHCVICCASSCTISCHCCCPRLACPAREHTGPGDAIVITIFQHLNLILSSIGYTVAAGQSLR